MENDRTIARDYIISREGDALLAADLKGEMQINPECANDILLTDTNSDTVTSEFNDIYLDSYTEDCAAGIRDQIA